MIDLMNVYRRIEEVLLVIRLVYLKNINGTYEGIKSIPSCVREAANKLDITQWTVTDKCTRQLDITQADFYKAVDDFIKCGNVKIFDLLKKSILGTNKLKNEKSTRAIEAYQSKPDLKIKLHNGSII